MRKRPHKKQDQLQAAVINPDLQLRPSRSGSQLDLIMNGSGKQQELDGQVLPTGLDEECSFDVLEFDIDSIILPSGSQRDVRPATRNNSGLLLTRSPSGSQLDLLMRLGGEKPFNITEWEDREDREDPTNTPRSEGLPNLEEIPSCVHYTHEYML